MALLVPILALCIPIIAILGKVYRDIKNDKMKYDAMSGNSKQLEDVLNELKALRHENAELQRRLGNVEHIVTDSNLMELPDPRQSIEMNRQLEELRRKVEAMNRG